MSDPLRCGDLCLVQCAAYADSVLFICTDPDETRLTVAHGSTVLFLCMDPRHEHNWALVFAFGRLGYVRERSLVCISGPPQAGLDLLVT